MDYLNLFKKGALALGAYVLGSVLGCASPNKPIPEEDKIRQNINFLQHATSRLEKAVSSGEDIDFDAFDELDPTEEGVEVGSGRQKTLKVYGLTDGKWGKEYKSQRVMGKVSLNLKDIIDNTWRLNVEGTGENIELLEEEDDNPELTLHREEVGIGKYFPVWSKDGKSLEGKRNLLVLPYIEINAGREEYFFDNPEVERTGKTFFSLFGGRAGIYVPDSGTKVYAKGRYVTGVYTAEDFGEGFEDQDFRRLWLTLGIKQKLGYGFSVLANAGEDDKDYEKLLESKVHAAQLGIEKEIEVLPGFRIIPRGYITFRQEEDTVEGRDTERDNFSGAKTWLIFDYRSPEGTFRGRVAPGFVNDQEHGNMFALAVYGMLAF